MLAKIRSDCSASLSLLAKVLLLVPAMVVLVWMTVFGGTALHQELASPGAVSQAVAQDYSLGLVATIDNLAAGNLRLFMLGLVGILLFTWLITSLDSATLVLHNMLGQQERYLKTQG